jgi:hypothetical protein
MKFTTAFGSCGVAVAHSRVQAGLTAAKPDSWYYSVQRARLRWRETHEQLMMVRPPLHPAHSD